jgi:hypothetical protein
MIPSTLQPAKKKEKEKEKKKKKKKQGSYRKSHINVHCVLKYNTFS